MALSSRKAVQALKQIDISNSYHNFGSGKQFFEKSSPEAHTNDSKIKLKDMYSS